MYLIWILASYLLGSLPFGLWIGQVFCHVDLRTCGSGNIGASNVMRVLGWKVALPAFLLDLAKGLLPVTFAKAATRHEFHNWRFADAHLSLENAAWVVVACGIAAIMGHNFSPFLRFKGGKGVATSLGVAIGLSWKAAVAGVAVWAIVLAAMSYISLASLIGLPVGAIGIWLDNGRTLPYGVFALIAIAFVIVKHKPNLQRLRQGTELKFSFRRKP